MQIQKLLQTATLPIPPCCANSQGQAQLGARGTTCRCFPRCQLPKGPANCTRLSPPSYSNARGFHWDLVKLYRQNYLNIDMLTMSMAQERHLVSLKRPLLKTLNTGAALSISCDCLLNSPAFVDLRLIHSLQTGCQLSNNRRRKTLKGQEN